MENGNSNSNGVIVKLKKEKEEEWSWAQELSKPDVNGVPVSSFPHAPLAVHWNKLMFPKMYIEVERKDEEALNSKEYKNSHWIAHVEKYAGYLTKIVYEGYEKKPEEAISYWAHFCLDLHRIGYCADKDFPIVPPQCVTEERELWREWIIEKVTGGYTMHVLVDTLLNYDKDTQLVPGTEVEVLDKFCVSRMRVGKVIEVIGHRVHVRYWNATGDEKDLANSFWCHEQSDSINVVGWSKTVGHDIDAPPGYDPPVLENTAVIRKDPGIDIQVGMKLEAVDPLKLSTISAATVVKVLKHGYFMIRIDSVEEIPPPVNKGDSNFNYGMNRFCYHITSPLIFPCGFCKQNNIELLPPLRFQSHNFEWSDYLRVTSSKALPLHELVREPFEHQFTEGAKLEAVDVMEPNLICVATVVRVVGRLLRIRFDGWDSSYDQWADAASCDLFPIGWCQMMGYPLEPPHIASPPTSVVKPALKSVHSTGKKYKTKAGGNKTKRRRSSSSSQ